MSQFSRLLPFVRTYFSQMALAGILIMGVAGLNLTLLKLGGTLWDLITVQRNVERMTQAILLFLVIAIIQSVLTMGQSYLTTRLSQRISRISACTCFVTCKPCRSAFLPNGAREKFSRGS